MVKPMMHALARVSIELHESSDIIVGYLVSFGFYHCCILSVSAPIIIAKSYGKCLFALPTLGTYGVSIVDCPLNCMERTQRLS